MGAVRVDVYLVIFAEAPDAWGLTASEAARAARFRFDADRRAFACTRSALRRVLAARLEVRPVDVPLEVAAFGKPVLPNAFGLHFNVSHTRSLALLAVADVPVGVDVEESAALEDDRDLRFVLSEDERRAGARVRDVWARKEAYLKARGLGLAREPSLVTVWPWSRVKDAVETARDWWCHDLTIAGHTAALCVPSSDVEVRWLHLD